VKNLLAFLKLTAQGGILVLLPILLFVLLLMEIVELVVGLASPIAGLFPAGIFGSPQHPVVLAVLLLAGASLFIGLALKSTRAKKLGGWIEEKTINRLPIYQFVKTLVSGLVDAEKNANFKPALFDTQNGQKEIIYLVEDLGNGEFTALFPMAPTGFAGPVKIISKDRIIPMDASLGEVSLVMNHMGMGAGRLLKKSGQQNIEKTEQ
jgi:uncharacterized membrane protein